MYGFNTKFDLDVRTGAGFQEFLSYVYGEDFNYEKPKKEKITKDDIKKHFNNL